MNRWKKTLGALAVAGAALATGAANAASDVITVAYVDDLSTLVAEAGNDSLNGVKLAIAQANAAGGVKGKQIKLVTYDGKVDAQLTSSFVTRAIEDDRAIAVMGGNVSGSVPSVITIANEQRVPFFSMSAAADAFTNPSTPYFFRFGPSNSQDAAAVADLIVRQGFKRVAIVNNSLPFGLDGATAIKAALKSRGVNVLINEAYEVNTTDVSPQLLKVRDAKPDVIVVWPYPADGGRVLRTMSRLGVKVPTIIARVALFDTFRKLAAESADGIVVPNTVDTDRPDVQAMLKRFNESYGARPPTMYLAMGYDGGRALVRALADDKVQAAVAADNIAVARVALRGAMEKIGTFDSVQGAAGNKLVFDATSHQGLRGDKVFVWAQVQGGKLLKADPRQFGARK